MIPGIVDWISPKGYGFVVLEDKRRAFLPKNLVGKLNLGKRVRVRISDGALGPRVVEMAPDQASAMASGSPSEENLPGG